MSSPPPDDFFELGPENEVPGQPGDFVPLLPEHEILSQPGDAALQGGYRPQWEGAIEIVLPTGERQTQHIRIDREEGDTDQDVRIKMALAAVEIERIIAERGGNYDITFDVTQIEAI